MINIEDKNLVREIKDFALSNGADHVKLVLYKGYDTEIVVRNNELDKLQQSTESQLIIFLYVDNKYGAFSTNRLEVEGLHNFVLESINSVRFLSQDIHRKLPSVERYFKGKCNTLDLFDDSLKMVTPDAKLDLVKKTCGEVNDERIISVVASYSDGYTFTYQIDSNGFEADKCASYITLTADVSVKGLGDSKPEGFFYDQAISFAELKKQGIASEALRRALGKIGQKKVASGKYEMIVDNYSISRLVSPLLQAIDGMAIQQKNSFLLDKLNKKVLSEKISMVDNPLRPHAFGSKLFDNEGMKEVVRDIFKEGILKTYYLNTYAASKLGVKPTTDSYSRIEFELGSKSCGEMIACMTKGIYVTGFNGGNCNPTSGDFSFGIEGFYIENGKKVQPISEMNITGDMLTLWKNVKEVGNDILLGRANYIPSILFSNIDCSGE